MACDDRQLSEAQRQAGYQNQRTGVQQAVRPFTGKPTAENLVDYINRELYPAVRQTRSAVNDVYLQVTDNAPSGNPLTFYFSTETAAGDPTTGRVRLNAATQDTATIIRVSEDNARLADVLPWLDVMNGGATTPLGVVTIADAVNPTRFLRFDLNTMTDQGPYWDLAVTPIESSHDNPFVDGGPIAIGFIPGVGGSTPATVPGTSISGADGPRQFLSTSNGTTVDFRTLSAIFPGAPIYDVMAYPFNAAGDGSTDDTAAINAAIAAANAVPGVVYFGVVHRLTGALSIVTGNNVVLQGRGRYTGGTTLRFALTAAPASGAWIEIWGQYSGIQDVYITGYNAVITTGTALRMANFQGFAQRLLFTGVPMGIQNEASTLLKVDRVTVQDTYGPHGILVGGTGPGVAHATWISNSLFTNAFPGGVVGVVRNWQASTAYIVGNVVINSGNIYQCTTAGTSAGSGGPSGIPGTTVFNAHSVTVTDGSAVWVFAMPFNDWVRQDSYAHTVRVIDCAFLQGGRAIRMSDSSAGVSKPEFLRCVNVEIDHCVGTGISLDGGQQAEFEQTFITSMYMGRAIDITSGFTGGWRFDGGYIFAGLIELIAIAAPDGILAGMIVGAGGLLASNTYDLVTVASGVQRFNIENNSFGQMPGSGSIVTRYGLSIASGCDNYTVQGNRFIGNVTGAVLNTPGTALSRVVRNNVPDDTMLAARIKGRALGAGTGVVQDLTGAQAGAIVRWTGLQNIPVTAGTTNTITITDGVTHVYLDITGTGDAIVDELIYGSSNDGAHIILASNDGPAGRVILRNNGAKGANQISTPSSRDWFLLGTLSAVEINHNGFSWCLADKEAIASVRINSGGTVYTRPRLNPIAGTGITLTLGEDATDAEVDLTIASSVTGLSDGDKGDITVSSSGTVWTVDVNIAKAWTGVHSHAGATHTITASGDVRVETSAGGLSLAAGHAVTNPSNADVVVNASGGVAITAGATPTSSVTAGNVTLQADAAIRLVTNGTERLEIESDGAWQLGGATGTAGQVMTSAGSAAPPTWAASGLIARTFYASGSGNHVMNAATNRAVVRMKGGGAGAGGVEGGAVPAGSACGGGGGSGAELELNITSNLGTHAYVVGAAGAGVSGLSGTAGGDTTFHDGSGTRTAAGGSSGVGGTLGTTSNMSSGGAGGALPSGTGAFRRGRGEPGHHGYTFSLDGANFGAGGHGGSGMFGGGGFGKPSSEGDGNGETATSPGAGGGGAYSDASTTDRAGGDGCAGGILVEEYS